MSARHRTLLSLAIGTLLLGACDRAPTTPAQQTTPVSAATAPEENCDPVTLVPAAEAIATARGPIDITSIDGTYTLHVTLSPDPVRLNELFNMFVTITGHADPTRTKGPIAISADAAMPQHGHGMSVRPRVETGRDPHNGFRVQGMLLHMPGPWKVYIDITEGAITERAAFDIEVH
ncbi:MAG: hypothetical protein KDA20_12820 [Phycisphaerales bacterium]|nr:hypothetical protein [Phycisphaerales bacterium]